MYMALYRVPGLWQEECGSTDKLKFVLPLAAPHLREALRSALQDSALTNVLLWEVKRFVLESTVV